MIVSINKFKIILPTSLLKSRVAYKMINGNKTTNIKRDELRDFYKGLRMYTKKYGHFTFLEIIEDNKVIISIKI